MHVEDIWIGESLYSSVAGTSCEHVDYFINFSFSLKITV